MAIVGPTGAGKTTMVNLLMRFYDIQAGKIAIDGVDTKSISREEVHDAFSMVLQDTWLFEGTIRETWSSIKPIFRMKRSKQQLERLGSITLSGPCRMAMIPC